MSNPHPTGSAEDPLSEEILRPVLNYMARNHYTRMDFTLEPAPKPGPSAPPVRIAVLDRPPEAITCDATPEHPGLVGTFAVFEADR